MTRPEPLDSSTDLLVLHTLRCCGFMRVERAAAATGLEPDAVESELIDLAVAGLVTHLSGDFDGWGLTESGRTAVAERITAELDETGGRAALTDAYEDFMVLNPELLELCTAWQMKHVDGTMTINDHDDADYDQRVLTRFGDLNRRIGEVIDQLSAVLSRFERYRLRLTTALERVAEGDHGCLIDRADSYHTTWAQLHEDLLVTLGIPR